MELITRRQFAVVTATASGAARLLLSASKPGKEPNRLASRPTRPATNAPPGLYKLRLRTERDSLLYIPEAAAKLESAPLVVSLHGSSSAAERGIKLLRSSADELGFLVLAPASAGHTWDVIREQGGPDAGFIDQSLARAFEVRAVDPARIAIAGISDGGSCSLALGLTNGDFFSAVLAFSPGFLPHCKRLGKPPIFISHGTKDTVFPVEQSSRHLAPTLKHQGYQVTYREFEGPYTLPPDVALEAMRWFMGLQPVAARPTGL